MALLDIAISGIQLSKCTGRNNEVFNQGILALRKISVISWVIFYPPCSGFPVSGAFHIDT